MEPRKQFTFYASFAKAARRIKKPVERCAFYDAIVAFALNGDEPDMDKLPDSAAVAFEFVMPQLVIGRKRAEGGKITASIRQASKEHQGSVEGASKEHSVSIAGASREHPASKPGAKPKQAGSITGASGEHSGSKKQTGTKQEQTGTKREDTGKIPERYEEDTGKIPERYEEDSPVQSGSVNSINIINNNISSSSPETSVTSLSSGVSSSLSGSTSFASSQVLPSPEAHFSGDLLSAVRDWLAYKAERREAYKPMGLQALFTQLRRAADENGEAAVAEIIRQSMASGYQGLTLDRLRKTGAPPRKGPAPAAKERPLSSEGWEKLMERI